MNTTPIRTIQVVLGALIAGLLAFSGVAAFVRSSSGALDSGASVEAFAFVVPVVFVSAGVVYFVLRRSLLASVRANREQAAELARQGIMPAELQRLVILGAALAEGPGLLGAVAVLIGGSWFLLAAPLLAMLCIGSSMPSRERVESLLRESH